MKYYKMLLCTLLIFCSAKLIAQDFTKFDKGSFISTKDTLQYRILFPEAFDPQKKYPVVFFLHGRGERGSDNEKQLSNGGKLFLQEDVRAKFPAIVIFPQCPEDSYWSNVNITTDTAGKRTFTFQKNGKPTKSMSALLGMIDNFLEKPYADHNQIYIGGLSMGGMGTYEVLRRKPKTFAAAFAICGGDHIANVRKYKQVPLWIFHGGKDDIVNPEFSMAISNQLKIKGKEVKFSYYPDANHNSWDLALAEPELLPWLFGHSLKK
ncbi:prolyl oligopeptidase family serine peptidase [Pedobacter sp. MC2016-15]|uniref:carboxylesterase family protein n=1 Tax=Pedobacter sp. MC2016-15 TaxID=2994473 RepID=UPI002245BF38|nr:prolyl oligopeptidase family serine peptidase [Pedobacter sp. MC2016-15]MCX2481386.1 prolyl oligopeptidase family serine peptidase [Pedobacter sp. MC2016-15]